MKASGATRLGTRELISRLKGLGKKSKQGIWLDIAKRLGKPRRLQISVNLWKLGRMSSRFPNKILLVPGKVLGFGSVNSAITVCALDFSDSALKKIAESGGKAIKLSEFAGNPEKPDKIMIVK